MPALSLVVCVHRERIMLERLLAAMAGCYDDLIVVHDGSESGADAEIDGEIPGIDFAALPAIPDQCGYRQPDDSAPGGMQKLVSESGGHFYEGPRCFQQEPHWPFAWCQARHDWILRLDADEVPSAELREWLIAFRGGREPGENISGYSCIWPLWDGREMTTKRWPAGRIFLFHRDRIRFFGMAEQVPVAEGQIEPLPLILEHRPARKSYGFRNLLFRPQAFAWRRVIAQSLLGEPTDLACWRWTAPEWPAGWETIRRRPLWTAFYRLVVWPCLASRDMLRTEGRIIFAAAFSGGFHHCLIALKYWHLRRGRRRS